MEERESIIITMKTTTKTLSPSFYPFMLSSGELFVWTNIHKNSTFVIVFAIHFAMKQILFNKDMCSGTISYHGRSDLIIQGKLKTLSPTSKLFFWAVVHRSQQVI